MKPFINLLLIFSLILFGYLAIIVEIQGYTEGPFGGFNNVPVSVVLVLTITAAIRAYRVRAGRGIKYYGSVITGVIILLFVFGKKLYHQSIDNDQTVLRVVNMPRANNVIQFEFKRNHHFRFVELNLLYQTTYYGRYELKGDTLRITSNNYSGAITNFPTTGIIKNDTIYWKGFDTMLIDKP